MHQIIVRRHQGNDVSNDFVVRGVDLKALDRQLRDVLREAQARRGTGIWSEADPEVWSGATLVARLGRDGDIAQLARMATLACSKT
ncbi:MAG: hypothetical protein ACLQVI_24675 [Polyangiaceae bacterium]|jgi:hypothetical protein